MSTSTMRRLLAAGAVCAAALVALPATAWAHVDAEGEAQAGGTTQVTFSFTHGCQDAPTTSLRVQVPAGTTDIRPENPAGWTSQVEASEITWSGGSIPSGAKGSFVVTMKLTGKEGDTIFLPTIQACPGGLEDTWIDKSDDPEATNAAPRIKLGVASAPGGDHDNAGAPGTTATPGAGEHDNTSETTGTTGTTVGVTTTTAAKATATAAPPSPAGTSSTEPASSTSSTLVLGGAVVLMIVIGIGAVAFSKRGRSSQ